LPLYVRNRTLKLVLQNTLDVPQTAPFQKKIIKKFKGRGNSPLPTPISGGERDTPSPHHTPLSAFGASILDPRYCFRP